MWRQEGSVSPRGVLTENAHDVRPEIDFPETTPMLGLSPAAMLQGGMLRCGSPMKLRAVITEPANVARYLRHLDEAAQLPARAPARYPPYFRSPVVRRKLAEQLVLVA